MDLFGGLPDPVKGGRGGARGGRVPQAKGRGRGGNLDGRGRGGNLDGRGRGRGGNLDGRGRGQPAAKKAAPMVPASLTRKVVAPTTTKAAAPSGQWTSTTETKQARDEALTKKLTENDASDPVGYSINSSTPSHVEERVDDPYDPAAPNDYVEIQKRKELLRTVERRERQRQQHLERLEREQERLAEERRDLAKKAMEGDAAALASAGRGMGRGRGGVSNLPAWMKAAATEAAAAEKPPPAPAATATKKKSKPTRVLQLRNLGDADEDFEQLREEIASECGKYGEVDASHAVDALEGEAAVYIRFTERRAAAKALVDLEGRFFAGQKISCAFFDEARFEAKEFG